MPRYYKGHKIEKLKDGRWRIRHYINNKQKSIHGKTEKQCIENFKIALANKQYNIKKQFTLYEYIDKWYEIYKVPNQKPITLKTTKGILENHIKKNLPNIKMNDITTLEINNALNKISGRPKEYASQYLREMFKQAYKDKVIDIDIYDSIYKYTHERTEGVALNKEQREELIKQCNQIEDGAVILFYLFTGCRFSEGLSIKTTDIEENLIHIRGTKTKKSNRILPIFSTLRIIINKLYNKDNEKLITISDTTIKRRVLELRKQCKFHFTIKDLRTTFGTMCAEMGINDSVIAKWLGHTNTNTTKKYYVKVLSDFEIENVNKFDTYFDT